MTIIVGIVVVWTLVILGVLIGISLHREATRRRTWRLDRERLELERDRADVEAGLRLLDRL